MRYKSDQKPTLKGKKKTAIKKTPKANTEKKAKSRAPQISPAPPRIQGPTRMERFLNSGGVSKKQVLYFTKNLAVMLEAGSSLTEALGVLQEHVKGKLKIIVKDVYIQVDTGQKLSAALKKYEKYFSPVYLNMIEVGEFTGQLSSNLTHLAEQLEKQHELKRKVVGASMYPGIVFVGGIMLSFGIAVFILPSVAELFANFKVELPLPTRILLGISAFFETYGNVAIPGTFFGMIFLFWLLRRKFMQPITHWLILRIPVVKSMSKNLNLTLFCHIAHLLLESGVPIDKALTICAKSVTNRYYKKFLADAHKHITGGKSLTPLLKQKKHLFPQTDVQIIHIGERSGSLSTSLKYCASIHEKELDGLTKNLATILEPILLVLIGLMVGFLALSIITPMYSITAQLRG